MDWLLQIREALEKRVFDRACEVLGLEVDLLFFDYHLHVLRGGGGRRPGRPRRAREPGPGWRRKRRRHP